MPCPSSASRVARASRAIVNKLFQRNRRPCQQISAAWRLHRWPAPSEEVKSGVAPAAILGPCCCAGKKMAGEKWRGAYARQLPSAPGPMRVGGMSAGCRAACEIKRRCRHVCCASRATISIRKASHRLIKADIAHRRRGMRRAKSRQNEMSSLGECVVWRIARRNLARAQAAWRGEADKAPLPSTLHAEEGW